MTTYGHEDARFPPDDYDDMVRKRHEDALDGQFNYFETRVATGELIPHGALPGDNLPPTSVTSDVAELRRAAKEWAEALERSRVSDAIRKENAMSAAVASGHPLSVVEMGRKIRRQRGVV